MFLYVYVVKWKTKTEIYCRNSFKFLCQRENHRKRENRYIWQACIIFHIRGFTHALQKKWWASCSLMGAKFCS